MNNTGMILQVYNKLGELLAESNAGANQVDVKLQAGTQFKAGDLKVAFTDGVNVSPLADVPAFTAGTSSTKIAVPSNVNVSGEAKSAKVQAQ